MNDKQSVEFNKNNPFLAKLTEKKKLTHPDSEKETVHFVVDIEGSGMTYGPGDSLGVYPTNDPQYVEELILALGFTGEEPVTPRKFEHSISLRDALLNHLSLANPSKSFLKWLVDRVVDSDEKAALTTLLEPEQGEMLKNYLYNREFIDLVDEFSSAQFTAQDYIGHLKRLVPRLYSIASSPRVYPNEVHLTVAVVRYRTNDKSRKGVASTYLADRVSLGGSTVPVFIANSHFKLPDDLSSDIIMVGPGTGVAPFRAFMQEYVAAGGTGRTWLFFGERTRQNEYLYGEEWDEYTKNGHLTRLDLAFSRDQEQKVYVQHKIKENADELWDWVQSGAYFYLCGDAKSMAKDVELELLQLFHIQGNMSDLDAKSYLKDLKKQKRYQKDVY